MTEKTNDQTTDNKKIVLDPKMIIRLALLLFIISAIAAAALAMTNYVTKDIIAAEKEKENVQARQQVLAEADTFKAVDNYAEVAQKADPDNASIVAEVYAGYKGTELVGYTVKTTPKGYGGEVEVLTGIAKDGKTTGITILSQSETAGLGARCMEPAFQAEFKGKNTQKELSVVKNSVSSDNQVQAITGATITSKAVTKGVNTSMKVYNALVSGGVK